MKQMVIFGGSFNPPINSHFSLAEQIMNEYEIIEKVIFVPVNSKYQKEDLIDNEHRYQMLKLVCDQNKRFEVSRIEIDYSRQLFTRETLAKLQKEYMKYEICFTMGSDNLKKLSTWNQADKLVKSFKIYVFERDKDNMKKIIEADPFLKQYQQSFIKVENHVKSNLSSTWIREQIRKGNSIKYLIPEVVENYIKDNRLYLGGEIR